MKKAILLLTLVGLFTYSEESYASNKTCKGNVTQITLNTDYNNDTYKYMVNGAAAELDGAHWGDLMKKNVLSLMLSAHMSGKQVQYWGSEDCLLIKKRLILLSSTS